MKLKTRKMKYLQKSKKVKTVWVLTIQAYEEEGKRGQKPEVYSKLRNASYIHVLSRIC